MAEIVRKSTLGNAAFWVCLVISLSLIIAGFIVPPTGKIDSSVLTAVGELFGFATLFVVFEAIECGVNAKIQHGKTSMTIGDLNDEQPQQTTTTEYETDN
jgi:hypothetical protein